MLRSTISATHCSAVPLAEVSCHDIVTAMEALETDIINGVVSGEEGLMDGLRRGADAVVSILLTFKTNVLRALADTKRTELRAYLQRHKVTMGTIYKTPVAKFIDLEVPYPSGMQGPYMPVIKALGVSYSAIDLPGNVKMFDTKLTQLMKKVANDGAWEGLINDLHAYVQGTRAKDKEGAEIAKYFTAAKTGDAKWSDKFASMTEFKQVVTTTSDEMESHVLQAKQLEGKIASIDKLVDGIQKYLESADTSPDGELVKKLAACVRRLAELTDAYATNVRRQLAIEHNLCLTLDRMRGLIDGGK